jgi:hypothetical protein
MNFPAYSPQPGRAGARRVSARAADLPPSGARLAHRPALTTTLIVPRTVNPGDARKADCGGVPRIWLWWAGAGRWSRARPVGVGAAAGDTRCPGGLGSEQDSGLAHGGAAGSPARSSRAGLSSRPARARIRAVVSARMTAAGSLEPISHEPPARCPGAAGAGEPAGWLQILLPQPTPPVSPSPRARRRPRTRRAGWFPAEAAPSGPFQPGPYRAGRGRSG